MSSWYRRLDTRRSLVGSDTAIVLAVFLHMWEGAAFMVTDAANGTIAMSSLLFVFRTPLIAGPVVFLCAALALIGQYVSGLSGMARLYFLIPQQTLFLITAFGALFWIMHGSYADGVVRPWLFIACDQVHRLGMPIIYTAAMYSSMRREVWR